MPFCKTNYQSSFTVIVMDMVNGPQKSSANRKSANFKWFCHEYAKNELFKRAVSSSPTYDITVSGFSICRLTIGPRICGFAICGHKKICVLTSGNQRVQGKCYEAFYIGREIGIKRNTTYSKTHIFACTAHYRKFMRTVGNDGFNLF